MRQKAQGIMEYVTLLAIVSAALLTMQLYFKQGVQAGIRSFADYIGSQKKGSFEEDYEYQWFTDGIKGLQSKSRIRSIEDRETETNLGPDSVNYATYDAVRNNGLADWSVGIEKIKTAQ